MKHNTILAVIFFACLFFVLTVPCSSQKQVRITEIIREKPGKMILKGIDMQGNSVTIFYGYQSGFIRRKHSRLKIGVWITWHENNTLKINY